MRGKFEKKRETKHWRIYASALAVLIGVCAVAAVCVTAVLYAGKIGPFQEKKTEKAAKEVDPIIAQAGSYVKLGDYHNITLKKADIDAELNDDIQEVLQAHVTYAKVKKGKVKKGDTVNIYYVGKLNGVAFDGGSCTKESNPEGYDLEIGSGTFIPGFEDGLIGKKVGTTCDVKATFPQDYSQEDLAGKTAVFTVTINYKNGKEKKPEFNDDFVKKNLSNYTSAEDYKTKTRADIVRSRAVDAVVDASEVKKYPKDFLDGMKKQLRTSISSYLSQQGTTLDEYLAQQNTDKKSYEDQLEKTAKENVGRQVVYQAIMQAENMKIDQKAYKTELDSYLKNYNVKTEKELNSTFRKIYGMVAKNIIYSDMIYNLVADYLAKQVTEE